MAIGAFIAAIVFAVFVDGVGDVNDAHAGFAGAFLLRYGWHKSVSYSVSSGSEWTWVKKCSIMMFRTLCTQASAIV